MTQVTVDPEHLAKLAGYLRQAQAKVDLGFGAPRSDLGKYPDKLSDTHGATSSGSSRAVMNAIDGPRAAVHAHLTTAFKACIEALERAKKMYEETDQEQRQVMDRQVDTGR